MRELQPTSRSSLFQAVDASEVLIDNEWSLYNERMHWAKLISPFLETLGALVLVTVAVERVLATFNLVVLGIGAAYVYYKWKNPPRQHTSQRWSYAIFAAALVFSWVQDTAAIGVLIILTVTIRFVVHFVEWLWYERLFITNRRVILAKGLLGADYSTMPLTRLTDLKYNTTIPGELLGYATVQVETAGQDQALSRLAYLTKPENFYSTLIHLSTSAVGSVTSEDVSEGQETDEGAEPGIVDPPN